MARTNEVEEFLGLVRIRAEELFQTGRLLCSEAVLFVLDAALGGGLPDGLAVRLASGLPEGLGGAGCVCGALSGGVLALGLFLTRETPGRPDRRRTRDAARELHHRFGRQAGSTCCRVLTKKWKDAPRAHVAQCVDLTGLAAETAARLILKRRPELEKQIDWSYFERFRATTPGRRGRPMGLAVKS
ncbi:MAG: C-GCAxxG-C-C family protein [Proteobacteria bacterium]|nr:C-GCAxxG-C-C family protein [Pseudomonadota bacterium]MBU1740427.1 C-GCAxxG-C-C family protein [Pseudomonadota bacterium]